MNKVANKFNTLVTFYDTQANPVLQETGGMSTALVNPRQEYGSLLPAKPYQVVNGVSEEIRSSTHILTTRYRYDISSFTTCTRQIRNQDGTTGTETYKVNNIQMIEQENRYLSCYLTLENSVIDTAENAGNIVVSDGVEVLTDGNQTTA